MNQADAGDRAGQMRVAFVDQNAVLGLDQERFVTDQELDRLDDAAGVGEIPRYGKVAKTFLATIGSEASPDEVAALFSPDLDWNIPGDAGVLPWVGHKTGRRAVADFVRDSGRMIERISFEVHEVLANNDRAVILGGLSTRIKSTGKIIDTAFAIILTIVGSEITRFVMLEDSFKTSKAARDAAL